MISDDEKVDTQPLDSQEGDIKVLDDKVVWGWLASIKPRNSKPFILELVGDRFSVGRDPECSFQLEKDIFKGVEGKNLQFSKLSRVQFEVFIQEGGRVSILDKSMNGVFVNMRKVGRDKSLSLMHGDMISIVQQDFEVFSFLQESKIASIYPVQISSKYLVGRDLGEGSTAVVREGFIREDLGQVAMKFIKKDLWSSDYGEPSNLMQEVDILRSLDHPCITKVVDVVETSSMFVIIMEYVGGGELADQVIEEHDKKNLDEGKAKFQFFQIVHTLAYLHSNNICHRDLKLENILLTQQGPNSLIKVTDFGLSKVWSSTKLLQTYVGTPVYMAPEVVEKQISYENTAYTYKSDCWSLGVVLFMMLSGHLPFDGNSSSMSLVKQIMSGKHSPMSGPCWEKVSLTARSLVKQLLEIDPRHRPSAQQVLRHPWLQGEVVVRARRVMGLTEEGNLEAEVVLGSMGVMDQVKDASPQGGAGDTKRRKVEIQGAVIKLKQQRISGWVRT